MDPKLVEEMLKPRDEEIEELKRQKDALMEELENIATADWVSFDTNRQEAALDFVQWAQSRARHTINRVLSGDVTAPLPEDVETKMRRPPTPTGWSDTDWIKHLQEQKDQQ